MISLKSVKSIFFLKFLRKKFGYFFLQMIKWWAHKNNWIPLTWFSGAKETRDFRRSDRRRGPGTSDFSTLFLGFFLGFVRGLLAPLFSDISALVPQFSKKINFSSAPSRSENTQFKRLCWNGTHWLVEALNLARKFAELGYLMIFSTEFSGRHYW